MRKVLFLSLIFCTNVLLAQNEKRERGEYTYHVPKHMTLEEAERTALERARENAIENAFGTRISRSNSTIVKNENGRSSVNYSSAGGSYLSGEWIETIGEPKYEHAYADGMLVIKVSVVGRIREIVRTLVDTECKLLRNGLADRFASEDFCHDDRLYLSFKCAETGYLAVYYRLDDKVARLLPFPEDGASVKVTKGKRHLFFEKDKIKMDCPSKQETNIYYILFSKKHITSPITAECETENGDGNDSGLSELAFDDFEEWLEKARHQDKDMQIETKYITIKKQLK